MKDIFVRKKKTSSDEEELMADTLVKEKEPGAEIPDGEELSGKEALPVKDKPSGFRIDLSGLLKDMPKPFRQGKIDAQPEEEPKAEILDGEEFLEEEEILAKDKAGKPSKRRFVSLKRMPRQQEQHENAGAQAEEDVIEVEWRPVEEEKFPKEKMQKWLKDRVAELNPTDRYMILAFRLLFYVRKCIDSEENVDWDYIIEGNEIRGDNALLPASSKYIVILLTGLLEDGLVDGFTVELDSDNQKHLCVTSGIMITTRGRQYLKENNAIVQLFSAGESLLSLPLNIIQTLFKK